jgi:hypothetical protein
MKAISKQILLHLVVVSCVFVLGCSDDSDGVNPEDRLCRGQSGFAALISGGSKTVEMCVSDQTTVADYYTDGNNAHYDIRATFASDSLTIEIQLSFFVQQSVPTTLTPNANEAQAKSNPGEVWFFYHETKLGTYDYVASSVSGFFTVTFNDPSIAVATFSGLQLELDDTSSGDPAGSRNISEGYVSVTGE